MYDRLLRLVALALVVATVAPGGPSAAPAAAQELCTPLGDVVADLGQPGQDGTTYFDQFDRITDVHAYRFWVPGSANLQVYVGDQWYDLDMGVYSIALNRTLACWTITRTEGLSQRSQRRVLQFVRPDERILENLPAGEHLLIVSAAYANDPARNPGFDPKRGFTVRVATGPRLCAVDPPNEPDPTYPALKRRVADENNLYQLALAVEPLRPDPFSLMTFTAFVSPPYTDLFDFEWRLDGRLVREWSEPTLQWGVVDLPASRDGSHTISVIARGAREYPDPDQPHIPPTLNASCAFRVQ